MRRARLVADRRRARRTLPSPPCRAGTPARGTRTGVTGSRTTSATASSRFSTCRDTRASRSSSPSRSATTRPRSELCWAARAGASSVRHRSARRRGTTSATSRAPAESSAARSRRARPSRTPGSRDRTLCYLASGKPAVVEHTGPSGILPDAAGLFRFRTLDEAARHLETAASDYDTHCRLGRALVEEHFDAHKVVGSVLERSLG